MAKKKGKDKRKQTPSLLPTQYDALIRQSQRDQLAIMAAMAGFLLFFVVALLTDDHGLDVYKRACIGAMCFGFVGWVTGHLLLVWGNAERPVFCSGSTEEDERLVQIREIPLSEVEPGMELAAAVLDMGGNEILPAGTRLDDEQIDMLVERKIGLILVKQGMG